MNLHLTLFFIFCPILEEESFFKNLLLNVEIPWIQSCKKDRDCSKMHIPNVCAMAGTPRLIMANNWLNQ